MSCGLCDSSTYDCEQRVVRDAGERHAVVRERMLVELHVLAELLRCGRSASHGARRASTASRSSCVRRAGVAMRERDVAAPSPGLDRERHADDARLHRVEARRSRCRSDVSSARSMVVEPALERCLVEHRLVREVGGLAGAAIGVGRSARRSAARSASRGLRGDRARGIVARRAARCPSDPLLELEALEQRR